MAAFTSVFYDVAVIVVGICGVYASTFITDRVVWQPVVSQRLPSVLVEDFLDFLNLFQ